MPRKLTSFDKTVIKIFAKNYTFDGKPGDENTVEFVLRLRANDDEATIILVSHLLIESLLDKIIQIKCKSPKKILDDHVTYCFSVKLQIIYAMGLLPDNIFNNIVRINKFRNKFSHNIEIDINPNDMLIDLDNKTASYLELYPELKKKKNAVKRYFMFLGYKTLDGLSRHMSDMDVNPRHLQD